VSKNFTQTGIGQSVEFSDGGARVKDNTGAIEIRDNSDASYAVCRGADPVTDDDLATRRYVISTAGEANTASNLAATGVFASKVGADLQFKGITSTGGTLAITNTATTVNIEVSPYAQVLFSRRGNTGNNTFFDVDDFPTRLPFLTQGAAGWPLSPTSAVTVNRLLFRTRRAAGANATFEVLRCQGNGLTGTAVSLGTVVIPAGVFEFDAAPAWGIPAGSWTLVARRTTGSGGTANAWADPTVILEVS